MKKSILTLFVAAIVLAILPCCLSCTEKKDPEENKQEEEKPQDDNKPKPGHYTFTASTLKGVWEPGDQIYVHGSYGPAAQTITLQASDISADGKTATVKLGENLLEFLADPDYLYAAWPASAVEPNDGLMDAGTSFSVANILFGQAYLEGTNFAFHDAVGAISFSITGGYDSVIIAGAKRPGMRFKGYSNAHSSHETSFSKVISDGYPFREEAMPADGNATLWFPGRTTLKGGFTLYFGKAGLWLASYTYPEDLDLKTGTVLELGDLSSKLKPHPGTKPAMPEISKVTKYAVKFNELSGICVNTGGDFIWALGDGSQIAKISIDGQLVSSANMKTTTGSSIDSEGMSINYDTGDILISGEANVVCRIPKKDIGDIFASSTFKGVESLFSIADAKNFGNAGAEGCTYYKNGQVYIGTQTGSYLYLCDLESGEVIWRKGLREMHTVITEIAGLCYDPLTDWLWVIDSESHRFFALTGDGEQLLGTYALKTKSNEESICVDHVNGCIWVGDDYGSTSYVYKYEMSGLDDFNIPE